METTGEVEYKGVERNADFYNAHISSDLSLNPFWRHLYDEAINLLPMDVGVSIIDLGCGPGYFAKVLHERGYKNYLGVDFAKVCIRMAKGNVPEFNFMVDNLCDERIRKKFKNYDVFIILQTLEHLEDDTVVLKSIPRGRKVILSVPSAGGEGHVRRFKSAQAVHRRYDAFVKFKKIVRLSLGPATKVFWLGYGKRI